MWRDEGTHMVAYNLFGVSFNSVKVAQCTERNRNLRSGHINADGLSLGLDHEVRFIAMG